MSKMPLVLICAACLCITGAVAAQDEGPPRNDLGKTAGLEYPSFAAEVSEVSSLGDPPGGPGACGLVTIAHGPISGIGWDHPGFKGSQRVIRNQAAWTAFWSQHSSAAPMPVPPPHVNFAHWVVLAAVQGIQTSSGGASIEIAGLQPRPGGVAVMIIDDDSPGTMPTLSNPFHIVKVRRMCVPPSASIAFDLRAPAPAPEPGAIIGHVAGLTPGGHSTPLAGAMVRLFNNSGLVHETHTNNDGDYVMEDVPPGHYGMRAMAEGYRPGEANVVVEPNQTTEQNFLLEPRPELGAVAGYVRGASANGTQIPLAGALVRLFAMGGMTHQTHTNHDGFYEIGDVPPGEYGIRARAEGYLPGEATVLIEPGQVAEQDFLLEPQPMPEHGTVAGHVFGPASGGVHVPLEDATVRLFAMGGVLREVQTNHQGFYEMLEVPVGEHGMSAVAQGYAPQQATVVVEAGQLTEQDFVLEPLGGGGDGTIIGHVYEATPAGPGQPLVGAVVRLTGGGMIVRQVETNQHGEYIMEDVPPGEYGMSASAPGYAPQQAPVVVHSGETVVRNFLLEPQSPNGGMVAGHVRGITPNGPVPLGGAVVRLFANNMMIRTVHTNNQGEYVMEDVPPGPYIVWASHSDYQPAQENIVVEAGQTTEQNFLLEPTP